MVKKEEREDAGKGGGAHAEVQKHPALTSTTEAGPLAGLEARQRKRARTRV